MEFKLDLGTIFSKKMTLNNLKMADLTMDKIRLGQHQRRRIAEIESIEEQKKALFNEAVRNASSKQRTKVIADQIKALDDKARGIDKALSFIAQQVRMIDGFIQLIDYREMMAELSIGPKVSKMSLSDLQKAMTDTVADEQFTIEKFTSIITVMEDNLKDQPSVDEDEGVSGIIRSIEEAREALNGPVQTDVTDSEVGTGNQTHEPSERN